MAVCGALAIRRLDPRTRSAASLRETLMCSLMGLVCMFDSSDTSASVIPKSDVAANDCVQSLANSSHLWSFGFAGADVLLMRVLARCAAQYFFALARAEP
jgi:hypothetical protein